MKGGVILIGSLLWDNAARKKWRENNLYYANKFQVYLPIRYGRCSSKRCNTYTMVFSNECYSKGLGIGWVLPLKVKINSFSDLKKEINKMGKAEGFCNGFTASWGSVALLFNPNKKIDEETKRLYDNFMFNKLSNHSLLNTKIKEENAVINSKGFLTIKWPQEVIPKGKLDDISFLIATVTKPEIINGRYPTPYKIANAMINANCYNYFRKNRKHEITTFQDEEIIRLIELAS